MSLPVTFLRHWLLRRRKRVLRASVSYADLLRYRQYL